MAHVGEALESSTYFCKERLAGVIVGLLRCLQVFALFFNQATVMLLNLGPPHDAPLFGSDRLGLKLVSEKPLRAGMEAQIPLT